MSTSKHGYNGARAKILRALANDGMLTVKEIAEASGLTSRQVIDNAGQARVAGLCKSGRDDVTRLLGYQITDAGRKWIAANPNTHSDPAPTVKESLIVAEPIEIDGNDSNRVPLDEQPESDRPTSQAAAEEPIAAAEDRDLYVVFGPAIDKPIWMSGTTLEDAQQKCISLAYEFGSDVTLYRLVQVGKTKTIVGFFSK